VDSFISRVKNIVRDKLSYDEKNQRKVYLGNLSMLDESEFVADERQKLDQSKTTNNESETYVKPQDITTTIEENHFSHSNAPTRRIRFDNFVQVVSFEDTEAEEKSKHFGLIVDKIEMSKVLTSFSEDAIDKIFDNYYDTVIRFNKLTPKGVPDISEFKDPFKQETLTISKPPITGVSSKSSYPKSILKSQSRSK
jgi:hypothetical protein